MTPEDLEGCCLGVFLFGIVFLICMGVSIYFSVRGWGG